jgi:hypothetical protein
LIQYDFRHNFHLYFNAKLILYCKIGAAVVENTEGGKTLNKNAQACLLVGTADRLFCKIGAAAAENTEGGKTPNKNAQACLLVVCQ